VWGSIRADLKDRIDFKALFSRFDSSPATTTLSFSIYLHPQKSIENRGFPL
jgi:hypothetical protein